MEPACVFVIVIFRWSVSSRLPLLWGGGGGDETQICRPIKDLITEMKERETIKDKRIKEMKRWKEVIAASPAESHIRSDHILRNAPALWEASELCVFPIQIFSLHLAPLTLCIPALLVTIAFPWALHRPSQRIRGTLAASGAFCNVDDSREAYIMLWLPVSHPTPLSPLQTLQAEDLCPIQREKQA